MSLESDRRRNPRVQVKVRMELIDADTGTHHVMFTSNLSCGGARCRALAAPRDAALLEGHIFLPLSEAGRDVDVSIPVRARVLRTDASGAVALAFDAMTDVDRAELSAYLFAWLADDSFTHAHAEAGALS
jgi:hypothetical protein